MSILDKVNVKIQRFMEKEFSRLLKITKMISKYDHLLDSRSSNERGMMHFHPHLGEIY